MKIDELHDILDPTLIWENALNKDANENSYYLYELHNYHHDTWGAHLWIFNSIEEFKEFVPALIFFDITYYNDNLSEEEIEKFDLSENYKEYLKYKDLDFNENLCIDFVKNFDSTNQLELIEFGKISSLFEVNAETFDKCKNALLSEELLLQTKLTQAQCQILIQFSKVSTTAPKFNKEVFLDFLSNQINEYLC